MWSAWNGAVGYTDEAIAANGAALDYLIENKMLDILHPNLIKPLLEKYRTRRL